MKQTLLLLALAISAACALAQQRTTFVFVKVIESIQPIDRGNKYEEPLDAALKAESLGEVTGGGTSFNKDKRIAWIGLDIELVNVMKGVPFLRRKLVELGAPQGSTLEYEFNGKKVELPVHEGG